MKLDPLIEPIVKTLWSNNIKTLGSCQGGIGHPICNCDKKPSSRIGKPFVSIAPTHEEEEIKNALRKYKIEYIGKRNLHRPEVSFWLVYFESLEANENT